MALRKLSYDEIRAGRATADELKTRARFPIYAVLENIRSMYNVGAAFRTSDAACIEELILCGYTAQPPRVQIDKTALGATETVPWRHFANGVDAVNYLKAKGVTVIALEHCEQSQNLMTIPIPFPVAIVVGNEVDGISDELVAACDLACEIPMYGMKQSLNAAVAYGIAVFELVRRYQIKDQK